MEYYPRSAPKKRKCPRGTSTPRGGSTRGRSRVARQPACAGSGDVLSTLITVTHTQLDLDRVGQKTKLGSCPRLSVPGRAVERDVWHLEAEDIVAVLLDHELETRQMKERLGDDHYSSDPQRFEHLLRLVPDALTVEIRAVSTQLNRVCDVVLFERLRNLPLGNHDRLAVVEVDEPARIDDRHGERLIARVGLLGLSPKTEREANHSTFHPHSSPSLYVVAAWGKSVKALTPRLNREI